MTFQAEVCVPLDQALIVDGPMRVMAGGAALAQGFMLKDVRSCLFSVALKARIVDPADELSFSHVNVFAVRVMAVRAAHMPLFDGMAVLEAKLCLNEQMALETGLGVSARIDDGHPHAASFLHVQASRPMTRFAHLPFNPSGLLFNLDTGVSGEIIIPGNLFVTPRTNLSPRIFCAGYSRRCDNRSLNSAARHYRNDQHKHYSAGSHDESQCSPSVHGPSPPPRMTLQRTWSDPSPFSPRSTH
jgi:hypothetical protein